MENPRCSCKLTKVVVAGPAPAASFKLCIYLSLPGVAALLLALMVSHHGLQLPSLLRRPLQL